MVVEVGFPSKRSVEFYPFLCKDSYLSSSRRSAVGVRGGVGDDIRGHEVPSHGLVAVLGEGRCRGRGRLVESEAAVAVDDGRHVQQFPVLGRPRLRENKASLIIELVH